MELGHEATRLCHSSFSGVGSVDFNIKLTRASTGFFFKISFPKFLKCHRFFVFAERYSFEIKKPESSVCDPKILGGEKEGSFEVFSSG